MNFACSNPVEGFFRVPSHSMSACSQKPLRAGIEADTHFADFKLAV